MKHKAKLFLILAALLVLIGGVVFGGTMRHLQWDFTKLSSVRMETNTYEIREDFQNISIQTDTADITFLPSDSAGCTVICYEEEKVRHSVAVESGTLVIQAVDIRKWFEHIGIRFSTPKITVQLPRAAYGTLRVSSSTGDTQIPDAFQFSGIDISQSTGDIRLDHVSAGSITLSVTTGRVLASGITCLGDLTVNVSTGDTQLTDVRCQNLTSDGSTGDLVLQNVIAADAFSIRRSTGDVQFADSDAAQISVQVSTGDVTGSLLSEKVFVIQTDTGRMDVPKTASGGKCEIRTSTGNILLRIEG